MDRSRFYAALRSRANTLFGTSLSQPQVDRLEAILTRLDAKRIDLAQAAYILGTAYSTPVPAGSDYPWRRA